MITADPLNIIQNFFYLERKKKTFFLSPTYPTLNKKAMPEFRKALNL